MPRFTITVNNTTHVVDVEKTGTDEYAVTVDGTPAAAAAAAPAPKAAGAAPAPAAAAPAAEAAPAAPKVVAGPGAKVTAPMPGTIDSITVKAGDKLVKGDTVLVLEAMKMKNEIKSEVAGTVAAVLVSAGQQVKFGEALISFE
ncbi:MAG: biotin/lipoyl-binding protein [Propionibacteriaceae bacterium]|jgi:biotin carboxyl carrier protein|nr:biotin/lipoyl-binding protein [Propionibacteriaceae bacterium]